ncbi:MAG: hypothetical protein U5K69_03470 [Balneolaceae bacterium]|nr:hypothetical protein [Balneolaceae bacterium]
MSETSGLSNNRGSEEEKELERLEDLYEYNILDTGQEEEFDAIARLAANICDTRISMINLVDERRQWTKSSVGVKIDEIPGAGTSARIRSLMMDRWRYMI